MFDVVFTNGVHRPETGKKLDETVIKELWRREMNEENSTRIGNEINERIRIVCALSMVQSTICGSGKTW